MKTQLIKLTQAAVLGGLSLLAMPAICVPGG